jgi:hypothetical protein
MKLYYFVGGPIKSQEDEFFRRLSDVGGTPSGWKIYLHSSGDGQALHNIEAQSQLEIFNHLNHFQDVYEHSKIFEITSQITHK